jgi:xylan 1,4-beta-xylosidase
VNENHVPIDFVSTHGYADDTVEDLFGTKEEISMEERVCRAVGKVHKEIQGSASPQLPLLWTEWNVPGHDELRVTSYVGPSLANTIRQCDGLVDMMSFWVFSDVFEEGGPIPKPFEGHFGLRAKGGINKPSYYEFGLLHLLGSERLANASPNVLVTRRSDGTLAIAVWNLGLRDNRVHLTFDHLSASGQATIRRVDKDHSNTLAVYGGMGSPQYPTETQVEKLNAATAVVPEKVPLAGNGLDLNVPLNGLVLLEIN